MRSLCAASSWETPRGHGEQSLRTCFATELRKKQINTLAIGLQYIQVWSLWVIYLALFFLIPFATIKTNVPLEHVFEGFLPLLSLSLTYCCYISLLFLLSWMLRNAVEDFNLSHDCWRKGEIVLTHKLHVTSQFLQHTLLVKPKSFSEFVQVGEQDSTFRLE